MDGDDNPDDVGPLLLLSIVGANRTTVFSAGKSDKSNVEVKGSTKSITTRYSSPSIQ